MIAELFTNQPETTAPSPLRRHPIDLLAPLGWSMLMLLPLIIIVAAFNALGFLGDPIAQTGVWLFGGLYVAFLVNFLMMQWIFWYMDVWYIFPERLIDIQLVSPFNRRVSQMNMNQVQDVSVSMQGVLASIFRFGNVKVQSAGKEGFFELRTIPNARNVADTITSYSERARANLGESVSPKTVRPSQRLGEILVNQNLISASDLQVALQEQQQSGGRLGRVLVDKKMISRDDLIMALSSQYHIPSLDLSRYEIDPAVVKVMPYEMANRFTAIPIARSNEAVTVAIADPSPEITGELAAQFDIPLAFTVADEDYIREAIAGYYLAEQDGDDEPPAGNGNNTFLEDLGIE